MNEKSQSCEKVSCSNCADSSELDFDFTMAFQPIINCQSNTIYGYEALVRGLNNESAYSIISQVNDDNRYTFDQLCRIKAIALASKLGINTMLSINFLPNAIYKPERCIRTTLEAAKKYNFPTTNIMFEFTEVEKIEDSSHVERVVSYYQELGFKTATDDFGSGYSGLNLLADFQTDIIKLDMALIRDIDKDTKRQTIVRNCLNMFEELNIMALAEGIETVEEYHWLKSVGIELMQGYLFAKPGFECLPDVNFQ
ncbi:MULTISPECIES: EAL domain-containing protein [Pseudoalteromonas]|jgi:EAL domain-containing protein (putative c-di-GMP-specific phosphodiesterase class I)|uniref:EAL domain-containing protein n=3 Tax=Bacteria TaxID=2 RepID=UPI00040EB85B|nr:MULTISPECIES: EAL domain-containing protein [Pseudoalteromonas]KPZ66386.1 Blue light- and temperature-regulated antirepressor YcgF [Pseudoalteromonas sp. P1-16-1b]MCK8126771.1 EAL domain-containing protein [Pseudoalteromonas sp. 2CM39R]PWS53916.1 EAL domain-containing protein [Pseudoalteromonas sp. meg-B1]TMP52767.1 EAL domain-containing protein [Pseudoalteromonas sp. S1688]TMS93586.1 EAL domain-containing protein [Pseudoalteromonas sp. S201]